MSAYADLSAAGLASLLTCAAANSASTGAWSQLDEATLAYGWRYPEIASAQRAFSLARHQHRRGSVPAGAVDLPSAARALAAALAPLGDFVLPRCKEETGWGTCSIALREDGSCSSASEHLASTP